MNSRRSFLKGILATAALAVTAKVVSASEMLGNELEEMAPKVPAQTKFDPINYLGDWKWKNLEGQPLGDTGYYHARL